MTRTFLHQIGETIRNAMATVPLSLVGWIFVAIPLLLLIWTLRAKIGTENDELNPRQSRWLRIGAATALLLQIVIYTLL
jgi:hypothetical protein